MLSSTPSSFTPNDSAPVLLQIEDSVAAITLNSPATLNGLDFEMAHLLDSLLRTVSANNTVRVLVIKGNGKSFMSGADLNVFHSDLDHAAITADRLIPIFHSCIEILRALPIPVLAAVHGPVAGGGLSLTLASDLVLCTKSTRFFPAYGAIGTSPDGGTSWGLTRLLGARRAMATMMLSQPIDAEAALRFGLVSQVVEDDMLEHATKELASRIARSAPQALANIKDLVNKAVTNTLQDHLKIEHQYFVKAAATKDFKEGIRAFFEKRKPLFGGE